MLPVGPLWPHMSGTLLPWIEPLRQLLLPRCWLVETTYSLKERAAWEAQLWAEVLLLSTKLSQTETVSSWEHGVRNMWQCCFILMQPALWKYSEFWFACSLASWFHKKTIKEFRPSLSTLFWGMLRSELCLLIHTHWCMEVLMWAGADRCEFFQIKLTVSLFIFSSKIVKAHIFFSYFPLSKKFSVIFVLQPGFSFFIDTWKANTLHCVTSAAWTVCTRNDRKTSCLWRRLLSRSTSGNCNKLYPTSYSWQRGSVTPRQGRNR